MKNQAKAIGNFGECYAAKVLTQKGHELILKNYRTKSGEIDIISESEGYIVFTEVKTRNSLKCGYPAESVTPKKIKRMLSAAEEYLMNSGTERGVRFDVLEIFTSSKAGKLTVEWVNHIENAVYGSVTEAA